MQEQKNTALEWVDGKASELSDWCSTIWHYGETAWREYKSAAWYVERLRAEGFEVEEGSGGMPTAFAARFRRGDGPVVAGYAEYDGVPGNCQAAVTHREPRAGLSSEAGGHTDPHSALGIGALGGFLAAKAAMEAHDLTGTLKFFGEPAEKVRGSKPIHAARGYYDGVDAFLSFHPAYLLPLSNTVRWDTHCGASYAAIYSFHCDEAEQWLGAPADSPIPQAHTAAPRSAKATAIARPMPCPAPVTTTVAFRKPAVIVPPVPARPASLPRSDQLFAGLVHADCPYAEDVAVGAGVQSTHVTVAEIRSDFLRGHDRHAGTIDRWCAFVRRRHFYKPGPREVLHPRCV